VTFEANEGPKTPAARLADRVGINKITRRQEVWLWLYLDSQEYADLPPESCGGLSMHGEILSALSSNPRLRGERIQQEMDSHLLPDERLSWIMEDERQLSWLLRRLRREVSYLPWRTVNLTGRENLVARLDIWDASMVEKEGLIEDLRRDWVTHAARDNDFDWFRDKKTEAERCKYAWEWLEKQYLHPSHRRERIDSYLGLLKFFDRENLARAEQQDIVRKIKRRWDRLQHDVRNPDSKQVNVMLPAETINQLDQFARQRGVSRAKVVATLIAKESEMGLYLDV